MINIRHGLALRGVHQLDLKTEFDCSQLQVNFRATLMSGLGYPRLQEQLKLSYGEKGQETGR